MKSWSVAIQMKAIKQSFLVVLFIMLYKVTRFTFRSVNVWPFNWKLLSYYAVQGGALKALSVVERAITLALEKIFCTRYIYSREANFARACVLAGN